jgi:hypothetical protein
MGEPYRYRLIQYRGGEVAGHSADLHLLAPPTVGRRLIMYRGRSNRRIITSPILRVYQDASAWGTYFETRNSLYLLQYEPD